MNAIVRFGLLASTAAVLAACSSAPTTTIITAPTTVRPEPGLQANYNQGAIFQSANSRQLFEERVARHIGDLLTITISENLNAANKVNTASERNGSLSLTGTGSLPIIPGFLRTFLSSGTATTSGDNKFTGTGQANNTNTFTGAITVSVTDVLSNGNLQIGGEKQIGIGGHVNTLRLTGVVNPTDIAAGNTIASTKVGDARIEQVGVGTIADANTMGWMQRLFQSVSPF
ncbi:flagellar basal body L-ring protein FlgH [Silvimonas sp. JCM 19000]